MSTIINQFASNVILDLNSKSSLFAFSAPRLVGTGGSWFLTDIAFYGLKLFSGPIISHSKTDHQ